MNAIRILLLKSDNRFLNYPCVGLLSINEMGTNHHIIDATFQQLRPDEKTRDGGPVCVRNPIFLYGPLPQ